MARLCLEGEGPMKKIILLSGIAVTSLVIASAAQAADLKVAASFASAPPINASSWTGFYAGLGLGFRSSRTDVTTTSGSIGGETIDLNERSNNQPIDGSSFRASPYAGVNWQFAPRWVAGLEGDYGFGNRTTTLKGFSFSPGISGSISAFEVVDSLAVKTMWDASVRGRLGFLVTPASLVYVAGGPAWQRFEVTSICAGRDCAAEHMDPAIITNSATKAGWTLGGGLEFALWRHWLARAEYRYSNFGAVPHSMTRASIDGDFVDNFDVKLRTHIATFGLAYKFGDPIASGDFGDKSGAVRTNAGSGTMLWTGLYAGIGLGALATRADLTTTSVMFAGTRVDISNTANSQPFDGTAFRSSPYAGFNWQFAPQWVVGIEGDFGLADRTSARSGFPFSSGLLITDSVADSLSVKTTWDAGMRARVGLLLTPATLLYTTGGVAWQHYEVTSICSGRLCNIDGFSPATITNSDTKAGWSLGGGIETAVWGNWLMRGEYRYADFGTSSFTIARAAGASGLNPTIDNFDVKLRTHTVTFGLAYKFN
jgi:outer membrane immunogenic protein